MARDWCGDCGDVWQSTLCIDPECYLRVGGNRNDSSQRRWKSVDHDWRRDHEIVGQYGRGTGRIESSRECVAPGIAVHARQRANDDDGLADIF